MSRSAILIFMMAAAAACAPEKNTDAVQTPMATETAAPPDLCAMLNMDELQTAAGLTKATGMSSTSGGAEVCTWTGENGKVVVAQLFPGAASYEQARQAFQTEYGATAEEVTGVGEKAFFIGGKSGSMATGTLVVQKGSKPVSVQVMGGTGDPAALRGEATAVAHLIVGRL